MAYNDGLTVNNSGSVRIDRLETLANYLDSIPDRKFDLISWFNSDKNMHDLVPTNFTDFNECGTTACACGHAAFIPEFNDAGFKKFDSYSFSYRDPSVPGAPLHTDWKAVDLFFNMPRASSKHLFSNYKYETDKNTRIHVIARMREFIRDVKCLREL